MKKWLKENKKDIGLVMLVVGLLMMALLFAGCNEIQQVPANIKPLNQHLLPLPDDWKAAYGDTLEIQLVYNRIIGVTDDVKLQNAIMTIAGVIQNAHVGDPNEIRWRESVEERLGCLEEEAVKYSDTVRFGEYGTEDYWGYSIGQIRKVDPDNLPPDPEWLRRAKEDAKREVEEEAERDRKNCEICKKWSHTFGDPCVCKSCPYLGKND